MATGHAAPRAETRKVVIDSRPPAEVEANSEVAMASRTIFIIPPGARDSRARSDVGGTQG